MPSSYNGTVLKSGDFTICTLICHYNGKLIIGAGCTKRLFTDQPNSALAKEFAFKRAKQSLMRRLIVQMEKNNPGYIADQRAKRQENRQIASSVRRANTLRTPGSVNPRIKFPSRNGHATVAPASKEITAGSAH